MTKEIFIEATPPQVQKPSHLARAVLCAAALGLPFAGIVSEATFSPQPAGAEATTTTVAPTPPFCDIFLPDGSAVPCPPATAGGPTTTESKPTTTIPYRPTTTAVKPKSAPPITASRQTEHLTPVSTTSLPESTTVSIATTTTSLDSNIVKSGQPTDSIANTSRPQPEAGKSPSMPIEAAAGILLSGGAVAGLVRRQRRMHSKS